MRAILLFVALTSVVACKQSHKDAWKQICTAQDQCCKDDPPSSDRASKIAQWTRDHVTNAEAIHDLQSLGGIERAEDRKAILVELVKEAGLDPADCALLAQ